MILSIQVQLTGPFPSQLDPICLEVRKVHKVHTVQKAQILRQILTLNSPFQEGVISEAYQRPDKSFFQESQELNNL